MATTPTSSETWTTKTLLRWMIDRFEHARLDSPRITAELLLANVLGCERIRLYMEVDRPAAPEEREQLRDLVRRALRHEPVQYLTGIAPFFTSEYAVSTDTLIPRPSTETLVAAALDRARRHSADAGIRILDIGTGTGCIIVSLLRQLTLASGVATDLNEDILALARSNAERLEVADRLELCSGSCFEPVGDAAFELIVSNPPYISDEEWNDLEPNVRDFEPATALRGGVDGLDVIRRLVAEAPRHLVDGGHLLLEIADAHRDAAPALVDATDGLTNPIILHDHE
ncbi:MAG: peptide chain release factor N(5)-glutamine methyltransferase, partial [Planctomycetota bacterium]